MEAAVRTKERARTAAAVDRRASRTAFRGLGRQAAIDLARSRFARTLVTDNSSAVRLASGHRIEQYISDHVATVRSPFREGRSVVYSLYPMRAENADGEPAPIDLDLEQNGSSFRLANPLVDLSLPAKGDEHLKLSRSQVKFRPTGSRAVAAEESGGRLFYPGAVHGDVDYVVQPIINGVEVFWQVRSAAAPETLSLDFELPPGARMREHHNGPGLTAILIEDTASGRLVAEIAPPAAWDSDEAPVEVEMNLVGARVVLSVAHHEKDLKYPLLIDPAVAEYWSTASGSTHMSGCGSGSSSGAWRYEEFRAASSSPFSVTCDMRSAGWWYGLYAGAYQWGTYYDYDTSQFIWAAPPKVHIQNFFAKQVRHSVATNPYGAASGAFAGIYAASPNTSPGWLAYAQTNYAMAPQDIGGLYPSRLDDVGSRAYFGLRMIGTGQRHTGGLAGMGGAWIQVNDLYPPTVEPAIHWPTTGWMNPDLEVPWVQLKMHDDGLGLWGYKVVRADTGQELTKVYNAGCTGAKGAPCYADIDTQFFPLVNAKTLPEGTVSLRAEVEDITEKKSSTNWTYKIDKTPPRIDPYGDLWNLRGQTLTSRRVWFQARALDDPPAGQASNFARSGVASLIVKVDGIVKATFGSADRSCDATTCTIDKGFTLATDTPGDLGGEHKIRLEAYDAASNPAPPVEFSVYYYPTSLWYGGANGAIDTSGEFESFDVGLYNASTSYYERLISGTSTNDLTAYGTWFDGVDFGWEEVNYSLDTGEIASAATADDGLNDGAGEPVAHASGIWIPIVMACMRFCPRLAGGSVGVSSPLVSKVVPKTTTGVIRSAANATNAALFRQAAGSTSTAANRLARALSGSKQAASAMRQAGYRPHHIVASNSTKARFAQDILHRYGISANDKANGLWIQSTYHARLHTDWYYANVNKALSPCLFGNCLKSDVVRILNELGNMIAANGMPH